MKTKRKTILPLLMILIVIGTVLLTKDLHIPKEHKDHPCAKLCYPPNMPGLRIGQPELATLYDEVKRPVMRTLPGYDTKDYRETFYDQAMPQIDPVFLQAAAEVGYHYELDWHREAVISVMPEVDFTEEQGTYCDCQLKNGSSFLSILE